MKIISIYNNKGGVGKTTISINLAACLDAKRYSVLVVDMDEQANTSKVFTTYMNKENLAERNTLEDAMIGNADINDCIYQVPVKKKRQIGNKKEIVASRISVLPNNRHLKDVLRNYTYDSDDIKILHQMLNKINKEYDMAIIDCTPQMNAETELALYASDYVIVPVWADIFSLDGWEGVYNNVKEMQERGNEFLKIIGVVMNSFNGNTSQENELAMKFMDVFDNLLFETVIRNSTVVRQANTAGIPLVYYKPKENVTMDFIEFTDEVLERIRKS